MATSDGENGDDDDVRSWMVLPGVYKVLTVAYCYWHSRQQDIVTIAHRLMGVTELRAGGDVVLANQIVSL
jgi:hypothetical protein